MSVLQGNSLPRFALSIKEISLVQSFHLPDYCCHIENPSFVSNFPDFDGNKIFAICLECSINILIKSNYAKLFQKLLTDIWFDCKTKNKPIPRKYFQVLNCFMKIISHPQIQHFMQRKRKLFTTLIKVVFFAFETLQIMKK
eukprot:396747_1